MVDIVFAVILSNTVSVSEGLSHWLWQLCYPQHDCASNWSVNFTFFLHIK